MACQGDQGFASCSEGNVHSLVGMSFPPPLPVCSHLILKYRCLVNLRSPSLSMGLLDFLFFFAGGISALLLLGHLCLPAIPEDAGTPWTHNQEDVHTWLNRMHWRKTPFNLWQPAVCYITGYELGEIYTCDHEWADELWEGLEGCPLKKDEEGAWMAVVIGRVGNQRPSMYDPIPACPCSFAQSRDVVRAMTAFFFFFTDGFSPPSLPLLVFRLITLMHSDSVCRCVLVQSLSLSL